MSRFELKPLPIKLAPRSVAETAQMLVDWSTLPGIEFRKLYPDFITALDKAPVRDDVRNDITLTDIRDGRPQVNRDRVAIRLIQHAFMAALGDPQPPKTVVYMPPDAIWQGQEDFVRSLAVMSIDGRRGYTCEFAPSPAAHRELYDIAEENINIAIEQADRGSSLAPYIDAKTGDVA